VPYHFSPKTELDKVKRLCYSRSHEPVINQDLLLRSLKYQSIKGRYIGAQINIKKALMK
jgi:hypothetical protein